MTARTPAPVRRARRTRATPRHGATRPRLSVHRTLQHTYAQIMTPDGSRVLAQCSTLNAELRAELEGGRGVRAAEAVGRKLAERALAAEVREVRFDRGRFRYHGRVRAVAEGARAGGLKF